VEPADNLYSQVVGWAKIILPLGAIALLSSLFLFARGSSTPDEVALARVEEIAREQRLAAPEFSGLTDDGGTVVISAKSAQPDLARPDTISIDDIGLRINTAEGIRIDVTAVRGEIDGRAQVARFLGLARIETSNGYELETNGLIVSLQSGVVTSEGLLEVRAPFGELSAGTVRFEVPSEDAGQRMLFTDGVRLLYTGQNP
jgi:lipopolysaccharide export system protein LptC